MTSRRQRNLERKWIWIGVGVAAVAASTAAVVVMRRRRQEIPEVGDSGIDGSTFDAYAPQMAKMCLSPAELTVEDMQILITNVFAPAWTNYVSQHGQPHGPDEVMRAKRSIAFRILLDGCGSARPNRAFRRAVGLAEGGRMVAEGQSG